MRIAIVNDLALAQHVLRRLVESVPSYNVAWVAADGAEAVRHAAADRPDAILMDLIMPVLDGVEATRRIMAATPCPILLVTSSVSGNFSKVYEAMGHGGLDAVNTPTLAPDGTVRDGEGVLARIARLGRFADAAGPRAEAPTADRPAHILAALPAGLPAAVVIVQHIAADFAAGLAAWLQGRCALPVRLARDG